VIEEFRNAARKFRRPKKSNRQFILKLPIRYHSFAGPSTDSKLQAWYRTKIISTIIPDNLASARRTQIREMKWHPRQAIHARLKRLYSAIFKLVFRPISSKPSTAMPHPDQHPFPPPSRLSKHLRGKPAIIKSQLWCDAVRGTTTR
jgi:hypothetical protein